MSYVTVYAVHPNGEVLHFGEARNNHGYSPIVWDHLARKYSFSQDRYLMGDTLGLERLWRSCGTGVMSKQEDILLGSTFDRVWIRKDGLERLLEAQEVFYREVVLPGKFVETIAGCMDFERRAMKEIEGLLGIAFNQCSAVSSFWNLPYERDVEEDYLYRPYNVLTDAEAQFGEYKGKRGWELMADLEKAWATGKELSE